MTERTKELAALNALAEVIAEAQTAEALLQAALDRILRLLENEVGVAFLADATGALQLVAHQGISAEAVTDLTERPLRVGQGVAGEVAASGAMALLDEFSRDERVIRPVVRDLGIRPFVAFPLKAKGRILGVIGLGGYRSATIPRDRLAFLQALGNQLGAVIESIRLQERATAKSREFEGLTAITRQLTELREASQLLPLILEEATRLLRADGAGIRQLVGDELVIAARTDSARQVMIRPRLRVGESLSGRVVLEDRVITVYDLADESRHIPEHNRPAVAAGFRSFLGVPFRTHGRVVGTLSVYTKQLRRFSEEEVTLVSAFADQAAIAIENAQLFATSERRRRAAEALADVGQTLAQSLDPESVAQRTLDCVCMLLGTRVPVLFRLDRDSGDLVARPSSPDVAFALGPDGVLPRGTGAAGLAVLERRAIATPNCLTDPRITLTPEVRARIEQAAFRAVLAVPLIVKGQVIGALSVGDREDRVFEAEDVRLAQTLADQAALALHNAQLLHESRVRQARVEALLEVSRQLSIVQPAGSLLGRIAEACGQLLGAATVRFWLAAAGELALSSQWGDAPTDGPTPTLKIGESLTGAVAGAGTPLLVRDPAGDSRLDPAEREEFRRGGYTAWLGVPVRIGPRLAGVLAIRTRQPQGFSVEDAAIAKAFASQAAVALENARLYDDADRKAREIVALHAVATAVSGSLRLDEVLGKALDAVLAVTGMEAGFIRCLEGDPVRAVLKAHRGLSPRHIEKLQGGTRPGGKSEQVISTKQSLIVEGGPGQETSNFFVREGYTVAAWVPITCQERVVGLLNVATRGTRSVSAAQVSLLESIGATLGVALANARLYEEAEQRARELAAVHTVASAVSGSLDLDEVLGKALDAILAVTGMEVGYIRLLEGTPPSLSLKVHRGIPASFAEKLGEAIRPGGKAERVISNRRSIVTDRRAGEFGSKTIREGLTAVAHVPITRQEKVLGIINVATRGAQTFTPSQISLLESLGATLGVAVENARLYRRAEDRAERLKTLSALTRLIISAEASGEVFNAVTKAATVLLGGRMARVWVTDPEHEVLRIQGTFGADARMSDAAIDFPPIPYGRGVMGAVVTSREPAYMADVLGDPRFLNRRFAEECGLHAGAMIPLIAGDRVVGTLCIFFGERREFSDEEKELMRLLADQAAIVIEKARLFENVQRAVADLKGKNAELDSFVYSVSHDLKAPLVTLQGMSGILLEEYGAQLDDQARHYLTRLQANTQHMERLILDLLALSRIGREARASEPVHLGELVDDVVGKLAEPIRARGVKIVVRDLPTVPTIRTHMEELFVNLLGNAIKYLGDTTSPVVEVGSADAVAFVECYVKDNGIGIEPAYHERIFAIFQRLKEIEAEGSGVGLAIVKKIVEGAGGRVWVESAKGQGATFRFTWPKGTRKG